MWLKLATNYSLHWLTSTDARSMDAYLSVDQENFADLNWYDVNSRQNVRVLECGIK